MEGQLGMIPIGTEIRPDVKRVSVQAGVSNRHMETIGGRVRRLRDDAGLNRQQLADAVGMKKTTLQTLEEKPQRTSRHLLELARYFGVSPDWLKTGRGQKYLPDAESAGELGRASNAARLDPGKIEKAKVFAQFGLAPEVPVFDALGDVDVFIAAYDFVADATPDNRARFDAVVEQRIAKEARGKGAERSDPNSTRGGRRGR